MVSSRFGEKPKTKNAMLALYLALAALVAPPLLGLLSSLFRFVFDRASYDQMPSAANPVGGIGGVMLSFFLSVLALLSALRAYRLGERSWVMWVGLVLSLVVGLFWVILIAAQLIVPH